MRNRLRRAVESLKRIFRRGRLGPDDPYSLVAVPKKPRPPQRSARATVEPDS